MEEGLSHMLYVMSRYIGLGALGVAAVVVFAVFTLTAIHEHNLHVVGQIRACAAGDGPSEDKRFCVQLAKETWMGSWPSFE